MRRKTFLLISGFGLLAIGLPVSQIIRGQHNINRLLSRPETLLPFCDTESILAIGSEYLSQVPEERNRLLLIRHLCADVYEEQQTLKTNLMVRVNRDFSRSNIMMLNGWVISLTEARQCALFSILNA